jgi:hypothetical protein
MTRISKTTDMRVGKWYTFLDWDHNNLYFYAQKKNNNGGFSGLQFVPKARSVKVTKYNTGAPVHGEITHMTEVDERDVPEGVREAASEKGIKVASNEFLALKVAARFLVADQPPGMRREVKDLVKPVNPPKGVSREVSKEHGMTMEDGTSENIDPDRRDLRPQDVFFPKPDQVSVRNLAETGKDLSKAIKTQIPKDKGYDSVRNLSQYLIETGGGGGSNPVR